jgi:hypothetical protein
LINGVIPQKLCQHSISSSLPRVILCLQAVLQYKGDELVRLLAEKCPRTTYLEEDQFWLLVYGLSKVLEDLDVDLTTSLRYLEIILNDRIKFWQAAQVKLPDGPFTVQGDMEAWSWHEVMSFKTRYYATQYMILAMHRALRHMKRPAAANTFKDLVQPGAPVTVTLQPPSNRLIDGFVGLWNIPFAGLGHLPYGSKIRTVMEECFTMKESTFALLTACGRLKPHIVIHMQGGQISAPFGPWLLLEGMWNTCSLNFLTQLTSCTNEIEELYRLCKQPSFCANRPN